jgi:DNA polymerase III epsilon subunit-like protein
MEKSTDYCKIPGPYGYKWPSLSEPYFKLFNKDFEDAHDAFVDVRACAECFFILKHERIIK